MKKKLLFSALAAALIIGGGALLAKGVAADETTDQPLAARIAARFGLNQTEVEGFFGQLHEERQAQMRAQQQERLNQAVENGDLTQAQADAIMARWQEQETNRNQRREEMQTWLDENGLDFSVVHEYLGGPHGHGGVPGGPGLGGGFGTGQL